MFLQKQALTLHIVLLTKILHAKRQMLRIVKLASIAAADSKFMLRFLVVMQA